MLKKCAAYIGGFMRLSTLIIIVILGVTVYFYQDKVREVGLNLYEKNSQSGPLFYANGIWEKMKNVQKMQENNNSRALELVGDSKTVTDQPGQYSISVAEGWKIASSQGASGNQLSKIIIASPAFSVRSEAGNVFYENGAQMIITVTAGEDSIAKSSDGGHGKMLISKQAIQTNKDAIDYYIYKDPNVKSGDLIDANYVHDGKTYRFNYAYNAARFNGGQFTFEEILRSFKIKDKK